MADTEEVGEVPEPVINHCPECGEAIDVSLLAPFAKVECPHCAKAVRVRTRLGNFQIVQLLGEGGMSQVFLAEDLALNRQVALKILHQDLSRDAALMALFEREAKLTASINHPNVVKVYSVGSDQDYFYIAMELVDYISLEQAIVENGMMPEREVLDIAHDVTSGLRAAFDSGLIHRDIKPGNILLTRSGSAKLVDFGLALQHGGSDEVEDLWATPFYVPPEKLDGEADDFRGDIYSLGATFFHALAGRPPFEANTASLDELKEIKSQQVSLSDAGSPASAATVKLIDRMMAFKPAARPKSYVDLLEQIEAVQARLPGATTSRVLRQKALADSGAGGSRWLLWAGIGVAGALLVAGLLVMFSGNSEDDGRLQATMAMGGDRVLTAGEQLAAAKYLEARTQLAGGNHAAAAKAFAELLAMPELKQPTTSWARFNAGLAALLAGEERENARPAFAALAEANGFDPNDPTSRALEAFFQKIVPPLTGALPVMPETADALDAKSFEAVGLLAYGLKNWNLGEFESALRFFEAFRTAEPPVEYGWIGQYRALVEPFEADFEKLRALPNPRVSMSQAELDAAVKALDEAKKQFKTRGAAVRLAEARLARAPAVVEAKKQAAAAAKLAAAGNSGDGAPNGIPGTVPTVRKGSPGTGGKNGGAAGATPPPKKAEPWTPEATAERDQLAKAAAEWAEPARDYHFAQIGEQVGALAFEDERVKALRGHYQAGAQAADAFLTKAVEHLAKGEYEGIVKRKEGVPIEAKVTAASRETVVVDLGFGPNELKLAELSPEWLLEVADGSWLDTGVGVDESRMTRWAEAAWFARLCGLKPRAEAEAGKILDRSPGFREIWESLKELP
ncbi:MAG: serine/threonine protein kinase [Verrucomicrobiae bacterium]|nr:serine/threonine protein kinase [Verrucomicrobiae bacterium]